MKVLLAAMLAAALAFASGIALGALSATVWVIGLSVVALGLVTGVALGAMLAATGALGVGPDGGSAGRRWSVRVAAFVAVVGWGAIQLMDDGHLLAQNRRAVALRERADSPLSPVEMQGA
ncbi:MAG: hypothetical protein U1F43_30395 [Myxococcota bacterium]